MKWTKGLQGWSIGWKRVFHLKMQLWTYSEMMICSSVIQVFPIVVMATPAMLIKTAAILVIFTESWPRKAPKKRVKRPDMEFRTVVLATLVFASAMFEKYCIISIKYSEHNECNIFRKTHHHTWILEKSFLCTFGGVDEWGMEENMLKALRNIIKMSCWNIYRQVKCICILSIIRSISTTYSQFKYIRLWPTNSDI